MKFFNLMTIVIILAAGFGSTACQPKSDSEVRKYELEGQITAINKSDRRVMVKHGAIPGYMDEAMTMAYPLKDEQGYDALAVGDMIKAKLVVMPDSRTWLEDVVVTQKGTTVPDK